jgi:hypothetical protein
MVQNRRKLLINSRIRAFFFLFLVFSFLVAMVFLGWEIIKGYLYVENFGLYEKIFSNANLNLIVKSGLLILWALFAFFAAYYYIEQKYNGIFSRLDNVFTELSNGQDKRLFFREGDPFAYVAESFNRMISNLKTGGYLQHREKISEIAVKLEELLKKENISRPDLDSALIELKKYL